MEPENVEVEETEEPLAIGEADEDEVEDAPEMEDEPTDEEARAASSFPAKERKAIHNRRDVERVKKGEARMYRPRPVLGDPITGEGNEPEAPEAPAKKAPAKKAKA